VPEPELSWQLVVQLLRQAAAALAFLHRRGNTILHNDVRAANMVLTRTYDQNRPSWKLKICDFGLAVAAGPDGLAQVSGLTAPPAPACADSVRCKQPHFLFSFLRVARSRSIWEVRPCALLVHLAGQLARSDSHLLYRTHTSFTFTGAGAHTRQVACA
jgi:serine/threonine protein kinase